MNRKSYFYVYSLVAPSGVSSFGFFATYPQARSAQARRNKYNRTHGYEDRFVICKHLVFR